MHARQMLFHRATTLAHKRWFKSTLKASESHCELWEFNMAGKGFWYGRIEADLGSHAVQPFPAACPHPRNLPGVRASGGQVTFAGTLPLLILLSSLFVHIWARLKREFEVSLNCANKFQKSHLPLKLKPEEAQPYPKSL